jgi:hypothetical protein
VESEDTDSKEQIGAKFPSSDFAFDRAMSGTKDAHIDGLVLPATNPIHLPILQEM